MYSYCDIRDALQHSAGSVLQVNRKMTFASGNDTNLSIIQS